MTPPQSTRSATSRIAPTITPRKAAKLHHQKRYLTGVWATGGADATRVRDWDVTNPADSRLFLGWLASPFDVNASPELSGTTAELRPESELF